MKISFTKMHGIGNDFILIDCISQKLKLKSDEFKALSKKLCDRRFGIGADQMLLLCPSKKADFMMKILNADGGEVEMCGNGIRCFARYIWDMGLSDKTALDIETLAGIIRPEKKGDMVRVDMGEPVLEPERIPVKLGRKSVYFGDPPRREVSRSDPQRRPASGSQKSDKNIIIDYPLKIEDKTFKITCVSMGNPHAVIVVDNVAGFPVSYYGPLLESYELFPRRTNVEFIEILTSSEIKMRVWERGSGETMACGTGAAAAVAASSLKGLTGKKVTVHLSGGDLYIEWSGNNHIYMTGPAVEVFTGTIDI